MAILWDGSLKPWIDPTGAPYSGAKAYFFDAGTTTPLTTYSESSLSVTNDHPVIANAAGSFPPIFLPDETVYRLRVTTSDDVTLWDVDNISAPTTAVPEPPTSNTEPQYLYQTGDLKFAWRTAAPTGFVRCNGRTIGAGASAATERANDDCEDLFIFLWTQDGNLTVSGGRGATASGDWAAAKTIALPDFRGRSMICFDGFGNSAAGRLTSGNFGADPDTLGSAGGEEAHTLVTAELPEHTVSGTTGSGGAHVHSFTVIAKNSDAGGSGVLTGGSNNNPNDGEYTGNTASGGAHTHTFTSNPVGEDEPHNTVQPSIVIPVFIKL